MTLSRMDACMWENPESAGSLQQRLADELAVLPPSVLSSMVCPISLLLFDNLCKPKSTRHLGTSYT